MVVIAAKYCNHFHLMSYCDHFVAHYMGTHQNCGGNKLLGPIVYSQESGAETFNI
jgi:hypothetical protein